LYNIRLKFLGMTQRDLAELTGTAGILGSSGAPWPPASVSNWELGKYEPPDDIITFLNASEPLAEELAQLDKERRRTMVRKIIGLLFQLRPRPMHPLVSQVKRLIDRIGSMEQRLENLEAR
jgi:transcriptional regulator with XRE-family HTH domain